MSVGRMLFRRLLLTLPVVVGVSFLVFLMIHLAPGDPTTTLLGTEWNPASAQQLRAELGLDRPLVVQYVAWLGRIAVGDFGIRYTSRQPVLDAILMRLPTTLALAGGAMLVALVIAVPAGIASAVGRGSWLDSTLRLVSLLGISMPVYWLGLVLIIVFAVRIPLLPPGGGLEQHGIKALALPCIALGTSFAALLMRLLRSSTLEVLGKDYVRTARSKGLPGARVLYRHVLKNAAAPAVTIAGLQFGSILGGAVLTEIIFSLPGLGRLMYESITSRDYPTLQGTVLFVAMAYIVTSYVVDVVYVALDPRVRYA